MPTFPLFPTLLVSLSCRCPSSPATFWQAMEENPCLCNMSLTSQRVKFSDGKPFSIHSTKPFKMTSIVMGYQQGTSSNMLWIVGSQRASIQQGILRIRGLNWPVTCFTRSLHRTRRTNAEGWNKFTQYVQGWLKVFNPKALRGNRFSKV